ncbi:MAG: hypothetical protein JO047_09445 [Alphaproteobacteria bacterium]|nr:hypothetical protein [Alphaproteobacteria bacterium]
MAELIPYSLSHHPAPHRDRVGLFAIMYGLFASPIMWAGHLMLNFGLGSHACYPGDVPLAPGDSGAGWAFPIILAFDIVAIAVIAAAIIVSYRNWRVTGQEWHGHRHHLVEVGEGRTRFLGIVGVAFGAMFLLITVTDTVTLAMVPLCGH